MSDQEPRVGVQGLEYTIAFEVNGETRTIKMTFGLLNLLMQKIGNYQNVGLVGADPMVNDIILRTLLVERDKAGKPKPVPYTDADGKDGFKAGAQMLDDIADVEISPDDCENLLFYAQSHMADFSLRALSRAAALHNQVKPTAERLSILARGLIGSLEDPLKNSSASPSTPPSAN